MRTRTHRIVTNVLTASAETAYPNVAAALEAGGLGWDVIKHPLFARIPTGVDAVGKSTGIFKRADNLFGIVRADTNVTLGCASARYEAISNAIAFAPCDELASAGGLKVMGAGEFDGGARVWLQAAAGAPLLVAGEPVGTSLIAMLAHDGKGSLRFFPSFARFFCCNQLRGLIRGARGIEWALPIRHTSSAPQRIAFVTAALARLAAATTAFATTAEALLARTFSAVEMRALADQLIPRPDDADPTTTTRQVTNWENRMDSLMRDAYLAPDLNNIRGTAWGAFNAVADYEQHLVRVTGTPAMRQEKALVRMLEEGPLVRRAAEILLG